MQNMVQHQILFQKLRFRKYGRVCDVIKSPEYYEHSLVAILELVFKDHHKIHFDGLHNRSICYNLTCFWNKSFNCNLNTLAIPFTNLWGFYFLSRLALILWKYVLHLIFSLGLETLFLFFFRTTLQPCWICLVLFTPLQRQTIYRASLVEGKSFYTQLWSPDNIAHF